MRLPAKCCQQLFNQLRASYRRGEELLAAIKNSLKEFLGCAKLESDSFEPAFVDVDKFRYGGYKFSAIFPLQSGDCMLLKDDGNPISSQKQACIQSTYR